MNSGGFGSGVSIADASGRISWVQRGFYANCGVISESQIRDE